MERNEMNREYCWDLSAIFPDEEAYASAKAEVSALIPKIGELKEHLMDSAETLKKGLDFYYSVAEKTERIAIYAMLYSSEDGGNTDAQIKEGEADKLYMDFATASAFLEPTMLCDKEKLQKFSGDEILSGYKRVISEILRGDSHTLSEKEEAILSALSDAAGTPKKAFEMLDSVDFTFPDVDGENGEKLPLSHGTYGVYIKSGNRNIRKDTFLKYFGVYKKYLNTITATYSGSVKFDAFYSKVRNFSSSLEAGLFGAGVKTEVYENLIKGVRAGLPLMEKYTALRKKTLGIDDLSTYDLYCPMVVMPEVKLPYSEAQKMVLAAVAPLGEEYVSLIKRAYSERWIDVYENKGKTTGAYSCGVYGVHPYVLLNYTDTLEDAFTLAHELGHSMHSYFSDKYQPYHTHDYKIMAAEVASTVNEVLLTLYLLRTETDREKRIWVLNHFLEGFRTTIFRQTLFAEFEKSAHEMYESGETLTGEGLSALYKRLNEEYYKGVEIPELYSVEWARIPHFYRAFYVYQYATGFSCAVAIARNIEKTGDASGYLQFLRTGDSDFPIEELKLAGVDLSSPKTVEDAMELFGKTVDELRELIG